MTDHLQFDLRLPHSYSVTVIPCDGSFDQQLAGTTAIAADAICLQMVSHGRMRRVSFARAFSDAGLNGVWATPESSVVCVIAGGQAYLVEVGDEHRWEAIQRCFPIMEAVVSEASQTLVLSSGSQVLILGHGKREVIVDIESAHVSDIEVRAGRLVGTYWDAERARVYGFKMRLSDGELLESGPSGTGLFKVIS